MLGPKKLRFRYVGVKGNQGTRDILGIPGHRNLRIQGIRGLWGLGEQSESSERPSVWDRRDPRKHPDTGFLVSQQDRDPAF